MIFGRDGECARIERVLDAVPDGTVGLALEGTPGVGKTTLWRTGVAHARERGYTVLASSPGEPDAALAFSGLGDLFDGIPEDAIACLSPAQRQALDAALLTGDDSEIRTAPDPRALPRATLNLIRELAADRPLLVAVDDEQWLDAPSARALAFALCRLRNEPIGVLLSRRPASNGALWPELERGFTDEGLEALLLGPLDRHAINDLLTAQLGHTVSAPLVRRIYEVSGGNPLYALAIARELDRSDPSAVGEQELPIPRTLADAIARRLARLDQAAIDPLTVAAALSNPTLSIIQSVLPHFALSDLESAERAEVVEVTGDRMRFTHPLLASTTYSLAPAPRRRELHRMLAEVCTDDEERAHHLALGAEAPDRLTALTLEQAAGRAARRGAPEIAAELLEQAARLTPGAVAEAKRSRIVAASEHHAAAGDLPRARSLLELVLEDVPEGPLRARALRQLAQVRTDDFELAAGLLEEALVQADDHHRLAAEIEATLAGNFVNTGRYQAAVQHSRAAVERAERAGDRGLLAQMLAANGMMAFFHGEGIQRALMDRAIELEVHAEETPTYDRPSNLLGLQLLWSDQLEAARPLLERALKRATERGEEYGRAGIAFHLAHLETEAGNLEAAGRFTAEAIDAHRQVADPQVESYLRWLHAFCAAREGVLDAAMTKANDAMEFASQIGDAFVSSFSTAILAEVELRNGQADNAHERLGPLRDAFRASVFGALTLPFWSCDIEALIALGRVDEADEIVVDLADLAHRAENPNAIAIAGRCQGMLLASRGDVAGAIDAMDAALAQHALRPLPMDIGRTLLEKGTLERRAKRKSAAKQSLEHALEFLEPLEARIWVTRARDELGRIGLRRAAVSDGLTPAQERVAELVLAGMSNRQIAGTLYMSLRTVESHLTKIYRELGVKSRAQLISTMSTAGLQQRTGDG